ncbi:MAG: copper transporter [Coriobacteriia bacterium]|nr:copper transporter [Coriobacteriia bacterium]
MYNLRYHIASLVAVFIALSVGLLLGTVVAERGMITDQTTELVADLQARFDEISAQNAELEAGLARDRAFAESAVAPLTAGQLAGRNVAIIVGTGRVDGIAAVSEAVSGAGGTTLTAALMTPALGLDAVEPEGLAGYFQLRGIEMAEPGEELERQVAEALVAEWRAGADQPLTQLLASTGLLSIESSDGTATVDAVVLMGSQESGCDAFGLALGRSMDAAGGVALGAESSAADGGCAAVCSAEGLSAVDHVATAQGRFSLVWILAGRAEGYFGSGAGAQSFYPPLAP